MADLHSSVDCENVQVSTSVSRNTSSQSTPTIDAFEPITTSLPEHDSINRLKPTTSSPTEMHPIYLHGMNYLKIQLLALISYYYDLLPSYDCFFFVSYVICSNLLGFKS